MFYLTYIRRELRRRLGRTVLTVAGLAVGVSLVVAITAVSSGLNDAQAEVLDPLASVGTDLVVTRPVAVQTAATQGGTTQGGAGQFGLGGRGGGTALSADEQAALARETASVLTDLATLGAPGTQFVHDFFLASTSLTFPASQADVIAKLPGVASVAQGLTLQAQHQEGTVPQIVAQFQTGGQTFDIQGTIEAATDEEEEQIRACIAASGGGTVVGGPGGGQGGGGPGGGQGGGGQGGVGNPGGGFGGRLNQCLPERLRQFRTQFTTPQQTITQLLNPPTTDITTASYTIAGVDLTKSGIGLITPAQISEGSFFSKQARNAALAAAKAAATTSTTRGATTSTTSPASSTTSSSTSTTTSTTAPAAAGNDTHEAVLAEAYASKKGLNVGDTFDLNGTTFTVVGVATPPLSGEAADVYLPLDELQELSNRSARTNVLLVRATDAASVATLTAAIEQAFPGATVTNAKQLADKISGSLVDANDMVHQFGSVIAVVVLVAAFAVAVLLTLSSVAKRVRELGTLKAIGWRQGTIVRQIVGESIFQGVLGGVVGAVAGIGVAALAASVIPPLEATAGGASTPGLFGLGATPAASSTIDLSAPVHVSLLLGALGLALLGGLLAGTAGALRAARLRPADALRQLG